MSDPLVEKTEQWSQCELTSQSKLCEFWSASWNSSRQSFPPNVVAVHGSVLLPSRLCDTVRGRPTQSQVSKEYSSKLGFLPQSQWDTDRCRREWVPLVIINETRIIRHPQWSVPPEVCIVVITTITPSKILKARKMTMRNIRIFLDGWYMAYNRVMMMTCSMIRSTRCPSSRKCQAHPTTL